MILYYRDLFDQGYNSQAHIRQFRQGVVPRRHKITIVTKFHISIPSNIINYYI